MKFLRRTSNRYSKLGKGRKKKQVWRNPTGRDNKMREKRKGCPVVVSIGYKKSSKIQDTLRDKKPVTVLNILDLNKIGKNQIGVIGKLGKKKKIEIAKKAKEMKIEIYNLNPTSYLKQNKPKEKSTKKPDKENKK